MLRKVGTANEKSTSSKGGPLLRFRIKRESVLDLKWFRVAGTAEESID